MSDGAVLDTFLKRFGSGREERLRESADFPSWAFEACAELGVQAMQERVETGVRAALVKTPRLAEAIIDNPWDGVEKLTAAVPVKGTCAVLGSEETLTHAIAYDADVDLFGDSNMCSTAGAAIVKASVVAVSAIGRARHLE